MSEIFSTESEIQKDNNNVSLLKLILYATREVNAYTSNLPIRCRMQKRWSKRNVH